MKEKKLGELIDECGALDVQIGRLTNSQKALRAKVMKGLKPGIAVEGRRFKAQLIIKDEAVLDAAKVLKLLPRDKWPEVASVSIMRLREALGAERFAECVSAHMETPCLIVRKLAA